MYVIFFITIYFWGICCFASAGFHILGVIIVLYIICKSMSKIKIISGVYIKFEIHIFAPPPPPPC